MIIAEHLTFEFDGTFQGAYRDIPIRPGEVMTSIQVSEGGIPYESGAPTALGSTGDPGSFGVENLGSRIRVVWHYRATDESRTFTVSYRIDGLAVAYDDVVDVNLKVWGDEWEFSLDHLEAETILPEGARDWLWILIVLGTVNVIYGAFSAMAQRDLKFVLSYS